MAPANDKPLWRAGWPRSLISILIGNVLYYGAIDFLPATAHHQPFEFDWGLAVDFWICVAVFGISLLVWPRKPKT